MSFSRRIYVDSRLNYMLQLSFNEPFFTRGDFPPVVENGSTPIVLENPWVNGTNATPFDQRGCLSFGPARHSGINPVLYQPSI